MYFSSLTRTLPSVICLFRTVPHRLHPGLERLSPLNFRFEEQCNGFCTRTHYLPVGRLLKIAKMFENRRRPSSTLSLHSYDHLLWPSGSECQSFVGRRK